MNYAEIEELLAQHFSPITSEYMEQSFVDQQFIDDGASAVVYRAMDTRTNRNVAIKKLFSRYVNFQPAEIVRQIKFLRERAQDSNSRFLMLIDTFKEISEQSVKYHIVTELCTAGSLANKLARGRIPHEQGLMLCFHIAKGVQELHDSGALHRDLKPANILMAQRGDQEIPVISDFGHAKEASVYMTAQRGSPMYVDPALINTDDYSFGWDIYSLGLIFLQILGGSFLIPLSYQELRSQRLFTPKMIHALQHLPQCLQTFTDLPIPCRELIYGCLNNRNRFSIHHVVEKIESIISPRVEPQIPIQLTESLIPIQLREEPQVPTQMVEEPMQELEEPMQELEEPMQEMEEPMQEMEEEMGGQSSHQYAFELRSEQPIQITENVAIESLKKQKNPMPEKYPSEMETEAEKKVEDRHVHSAQDIRPQNSEWSEDRGIMPMDEMGGMREVKKKKIMSAVEEQRNERQEGGMSNVSRSSHILGSQKDKNTPIPSPTRCRQHFNQPVNSLQNQLVLADIRIEENQNMLPILRAIWQHQECIKKVQTIMAFPLEPIRKKGLVLFGYLYWITQLKHENLKEEGERCLLECYITSLIQKIDGLRTEMLSGDNIHALRRQAVSAIRARYYDQYDLAIEYNNLVMNCGLGAFDREQLKSIIFYDS